MSGLGISGGMGFATKQKPNDDLFRAVQDAAGKPASDNADYWTLKDYANTSGHSDIQVGVAYQHIADEYELTTESNGGHKPQYADRAQMTIDSVKTNTDAARYGEIMRADPDLGTNSVVSLVHARDPELATDVAAGMKALRFDTEGVTITDGFTNAVNGHANISKADAGKAYASSLLNVGYKYQEDHRAETAYNAKDPFAFEHDPKFFASVEQDALKKLGIG